MTLIVMVGCQAAGKTTLSKKLEAEYGFARVSIDEYGFLKYSEMIAPALEFLEAGKSVVLDGTYHTLKIRKELLDAIKHIQCKKMAIYIDVPKEECVRRNRARGVRRTINDLGVKRTHDELIPPSYNEGWDEVYVINQNMGVELNG